MLTIITEPSVYLVGSTEVRQPALADFLRDNDIEAWSTDATSGGEALAEIAGRGCYWSFKTPRPGGNKAYIQRILEQSHGSVLEHACFNFFITGVSRSFTHELVRHRAGMGYSQLSQRFVDESNCSFVMPPLIRDLIDWDNVPSEHGGSIDPEDAEDVDGFCPIWTAWYNAASVAIKAYEELETLITTQLIVNEFPRTKWHDDHGPESFVELNDAIASIPTERRTSLRKQVREAARSVLPNATETKIFVTGNARALRNFIEMRGDIAADAEIRRVAIAVLRLLQVEAPNLFGDYEIVTTDGVEHVTTEYRKV